MPDTEQRIRDLNEISIAIDTWDDIFSDFDPRPLNERALSEDFITELKKRYKETRTGNFIISIYAPLFLKDIDVEKMVIQRIKRFFKHRYLLSERDVKNIRARGVIFVIVGICFLSILTLITYYSLLSKLVIEISGIILMPLGWFGIWEGLSQIVDTSPKSVEDSELFNKLFKADYRFIYIDGKDAGDSVNNIQTIN